MKSKRFTVSDTGIGKSALSISFRLLLFNALLVFLPVAAVLYLDIYEEQLLVSQEKTMVQQGRILAASLSEQGAVSKEKVKAILANLAGRTETRLRVLDGEGLLIGDTSSPAEPELQEAPEPEDSGGRYDSLKAVEEVIDRDSLLYRAATYPVRVYRKLFNPPVPVGEPDDYDARYPFDGKEVRAALAGRYGAATRLSSGGQRSVTLYTAIPVYSGGEVVGAVLSSQSTYRILKDLYEIRLFILRIFVASLAAALFISLFLSRTISSRIRKLGREARSISTGKGRIRGSFSEMKLNDEIGILSKALIDLTDRLDRHIRFIDSLSRDLSHEFKNPLAVIRSASDMAGTTEGEEKMRFLTMINENTARMESLLNGVEEISRLDSRLEKEERTPVRTDELVPKLLEAFRLRFPRISWEYECAGKGLSVLASADRLSQIFVNLYENAASFSEGEGTVRTEIRRERDRVAIVIGNRGPLIPEGDLDRIFDRFFSSRDTGKDRHHGLGLSIVKTIVENFGGTVRAGNGADGPFFTLSFPLDTQG